MEQKKDAGFWSEFKKFITRGNVVDMAVGVVIGASFGKIITGLVNDIINPLIGLILKSGSLDGIKTVIQPAVLDAAGAVAEPESAILWGTWVQTVLDFLITAFCIFVVLRIIMKAKNRLEAKKLAEAEAKAAEEKAKAEAAEAKAKAEAEAAAASRAALEQSILRQEKLLTEICAQLKKK